MLDNRTQRLTDNMVKQYETYKNKDNKALLERTPQQTQPTKLHIIGL